MPRISGPDSGQARMGPTARTCRPIRRPSTLIVDGAGTLGRMAPTPPTAPVALSDGHVHLEPTLDTNGPAIRRWNVLRPRSGSIVGSVTLRPDVGSPRGLLSIEIAESAPGSDLQSMAQGVRLVCQWAFVAMDLPAIAWLGATSPTTRAVVHQAGFRVHPFPQRGALGDSDGAQDAWFADITPQDPTETVGESLTAREQHVLALMARGRSNAQIADQLAISENTVKNHVRSILETLHAPSRTAAVVLALRNGLVSLEG